MLRDMTTGPSIEAELVRVDAGESSPMRRLGPAPATLIVAGGRGDVLAGDLWIAVEAGDSVVLDPGDENAIRASADGPLTAVLARLVGRGASLRPAPAAA